VCVSDSQEMWLVKIYASKYKQVYYKTKIMTIYSITQSLNFKSSVTFGIKSNTNSESWIWRLLSLKESDTAKNKSVHLIEQIQ